jgi:hypothetical protein
MPVLHSRRHWALSYPNHSHEHYEPHRHLHFGHVCAEWKLRGPFKVVSRETGKSLHKAEAEQDANAAYQNAFTPYTDKTGQYVHEAMFGNPNFGQVAQAADPRILQLAARLQF